MADVTRLVRALESYSRELERHNAHVSNAYQQLERSLASLSGVYEGVAAREFQNHWQRTKSGLAEYTKAPRRSTGSSKSGCRRLRPRTGRKACDEVAEPARVVAAISDVADELQKWTQAASQASDEAWHIHGHGVEQVTMADRLGALATHHAIEGAGEIGHVRQSAERAVASAEDAAGGVAYRISAIDNARAFATAMLAAWQGELDAAVNWLGRARERVRRAEAWVRAATEQVARARSAVSHAESDLRSCKRDTERRNCNPEASRLRAAQAAMAAAQRELKQAEDELRLAREEEARAERRVSCCHQAVARAQSAVEIGAQAAAEVVEARHLSTWAGDHARSSVNSTTRAAEAGRAQQAAASATHDAAQRAGVALSDAAGAVQRADGRYQDARRLAFDAAADMATAIQRLRQFDQAAGL